MGNGISLHFFTILLVYVSRVLSCGVSKEEEMKRPEPDPAWEEKRGKITPVNAKFYK